MNIGKRILKTHPMTLVLISFLMVIILGAAILMLPVSTISGTITWLDALFTATSAVCVTGLVVVDTGSYFTVFGQCVILALIQVGGLGVMTISVALFQWMGRIVSFRYRMVMQDLFAHTPREDIFGLVKNIILFTIGAELLGAVFLTFHWCSELPFSKALYTGVFHSVSAFCNAGFALYPDSMTGYSSSLLLNGVICSLIVAGGIGFPVLYDLQSWIIKRKNKRVRLLIQTKAVLLTTIFLIISGALMFAFLERQLLGEAQSISHGFLISIFQSITCRTAGFNTVDIASLKDATIALMIFLMFFGASPGSCGGGVKTTTLALLTAFTISRIRKSQRVNMFSKSIPNETVTRGVSLILVSFGIICLVLFMLLAGDSADHSLTGAHGSFLAYLFETVSAFATVGLSMGLTPDLNSWGKCWIIIMMIIGRVGVLTFAYIVVGTGVTNGIEYSEENLMIG
ncbi:Potassium transporter domain-containing protein, TrkH-like [Desulfonema limicola]|uniref:Potassium transporter domain-containing protein, TrkH-like n=1 Tax=Desulfonema limicola TaxID=45656 RepID=A0A975GHU1_9BACT|nr:TrkH family potassium uptake protein [Desulfonema limicola]QTA81073.1 Potassium transporter domain-containing protein, TrkH-like [Desulfonema limicola]